MTQENMLARYSILHELGRGPTGAVYVARVRTTGAVVALKRLDPALLSNSDPSIADRVLKRARSARLLKHGNIIEMGEAGAAGGTVYLAMEMLEGASLREILDEGPLPIVRAIQITHDIACALAYVHLEGVVHGRLKPSNIVVLRSGVVKITDFGIGQLGQAALFSGPRSGSLSYMSPEQVRGDALDHRSDLFSLGALLYEMLAHRPPFEGDSPKAVTENILHAKPRPPSEQNQHIPRALDAIVLSLLAKQPAERMPGAPILVGELERLEQGLGLGPRATAASDEPAASVPPAPAEPAPRTSVANEFQDGEPAIRIQPDQSREAVRQPDRANDRDVFDYQKALMERESRTGRSSRSRPATFAALALVLAALGVGLAGFMGLTGFTGLTGFMNDLAARSVRAIPASPAREAPVPVPAPVASRPTAPPLVAVASKESAITPDVPKTSPARVEGEEQAKQEPSGVLSTPAPMPPKAPATEPGPLPQAASSVALAPEQPAPASAVPAPELPRAMQTTPAEGPAQQRGGTARVVVTVSPGGEIYIDDQHYGTTPPITTFDLHPGMHRIEVRSGSRKPYLTYMTVQAGDVRRIQHDFEAKPSRPPG
jgi:serine/threonine protein kinase